MQIKGNEIRGELGWWIQSSKGEGRQPQAAPGEAQLGQQQEFLHGKGAQALAEAPQGVVESQSLDMFIK